MSPVRLLILGILFYILYKLLFGSSKAVPGQAENQEAGLKAQDILVQDPVCHVYIPRKQAVQLQHRHQTHYFCSSECCERFKKELKTADSS